MNETYAECLVKRKTPVYSYVMIAVMIVITALCVFTVPVGGIVSIIAVLVAGIASYFLIRNSNVEYEYLYVSGQLSIDKILGRSKRKKAWECSMEEVRIIAPADSYMLKDFENSNMKILDFTSCLPGAKVYAVLVNSGGQATKVLFEPNDKMYQCFRRTAPRKVIQ